MGKTKTNLTCEPEIIDDRFYIPKKILTMTKEEIQTEIKKMEIELGITK